MKRSSELKQYNIAYCNFHLIIFFLYSNVISCAIVFQGFRSNVKVVLYCYAIHIILHRNAIVRICNAFFYFFLLHQLFIFYLFFHFIFVIPSTILWWLKFYLCTLANNNNSRSNVFFIFIYI